MEHLELLYIDLFCGAGGTSTGVESAVIDNQQCAKVIACVNHDANAISSHAANHPDALHFTEDIRTLELSPLKAHLEKYKGIYPSPKVVLWASLECTNFSKAKGGLPRDADSRTLAEHLFRYIDALNPDYIQIENVEEFMGWGDMDENGHPLSRDKGRRYLKWVSNVRKYGYRFDWRILNSADYGAYTCRRRFFGIFAKEGLPIVFPKQTHAERKLMQAADKEKSLFPEQNHLKPWNAVRDVLDLEDKGESIFGRKKPLCENTLKRIYAGLVKFVAGGKDAFLVKYNSMSKKGVYHAPGLDEPSPVVATQNRLGLAEVNFLSKQFSGHPSSKNISVDGPCGAITTIDHHAFISAYYGNGDNVHSVDEPSATVTTADRFSLVQSVFLDQQYGNGRPTDINKPAGTLTTNPKFNVIHCERFLMNPQFQSAGGSVDKPCFTLIARMDKLPPYLISTEKGEFAIQILESDTPMIRKIKHFMAMYGILDITMRMLKVPELKRIMGFPTDYVLVGTQADQKKFIGNAVEVNTAKAWCKALCLALKEQRERHVA